MSNTKYGIGDLVVCKYDVERMFYPGFKITMPERNTFFIGIIISKQKVQHFKEYNIIYDILCVDGVRRYFTIWEIELIRAALP